MPNGAVAKPSVRNLEEARFDLLRTLAAMRDIRAESGSLLFPVWVPLSAGAPDFRTHLPACVRIVGAYVTRTPLADSESIENLLAAASIIPHRWHDAQVRLILEGDAFPPTADDRPLPTLDLVLRRYEDGRVTLDSLTVRPRE